ncbi:MAG: DUF4974 domain-containing protein [Bacteroidaceae bacterium]|nr:DUF4974 domain-containing protein [Bacteroidaceae bacterium]
MEHKERIRILLSMQEHPERYSDEQIQQMLADDSELAELLEQLTLTKQAFVKQEADEEVVPVEEEWREFSENHAEELDTIVRDNESGAKTAFIRHLTGIIPSKFVASFVGVLVTASMAFAAIHIVRMASINRQAVQTEQHVSSHPNDILPTDTLKSDTVITTQSIVFDNVPLEKMLAQIATQYQKGVEFNNDEARHLRFYFVWKPNEGLEVTLHRLNLFESITIELKDNMIVVE